VYISHIRNVLQRQVTRSSRCEIKLFH